MNQRAEEVWDKAVANWSEHFRKQRKIGPTTATEADDIIVETIAAALGQARREGIEAMRDAVYQVICQDVDRNFFDAHYVEVVLREEAKSLLAKIDESKLERG